jgi:hypothetical protein
MTKFMVTPLRRLRSSLGAAEIDYSCATVPGRLEIAGSRRTKVTVRATRVGVGTVPYHASKRRVWVGRVKGQQHERTTGATAGERSTTRSSHGALGDRTMRSIWLVLSKHRPPYRHTLFQAGMCYSTLRASAILETGECAIQGDRPTSSK